MRLKSLTEFHQQALHWFYYFMYMYYLNQNDGIRATNQELANPLTIHGYI